MSANDQIRQSKFCIFQTWSWCFTIFTTGRLSLLWRLKAVLSVRDISLLDINTSGTALAVDSLEGGGVTNQEVSAGQTRVAGDVKILHWAAGLTDNGREERNIDEETEELPHDFDSYNCFQDQTYPSARVQNNWFVFACKLSFTC